MSKVPIMFVQVITIITLRTLLFITHVIHINVIHILVQFKILCLLRRRRRHPFVGPAF